MPDDQVAVARWRGQHRRRGRDLAWYPHARRSRIDPCQSGRDAGVFGNTVCRGRGARVVGETRRFVGGAVCTAHQADFSHHAASAHRADPAQRGGPDVDGNECLGGADRGGLRVLRSQCVHACVSIRDGSDSDAVSRDAQVSGWVNPHRNSWNCWLLRMVHLPKERRNVSADAHGKPMRGKKSLSIVLSWTGRSSVFAQRATPDKCIAPPCSRSQPICEIESLKALC